MAGVDNLIPINERPENEQKEMRLKAGIRSGEVRRERKTLRETLLMMLKEGNIQDNITLALLNKAAEGDVKAFEVMRDTIGEKPKETLEIENAPSLTFGKRQDNESNTNS